VEPPDLLGLFIPPSNELGLTYMITGAVAAVVYGEPRLTRDLDVVLTLAPGDGARLAGAFPESFPHRARRGHRRGAPADDRWSLHHHPPRYGVEGRRVSRRDGPTARLGAREADPGGGGGSHGLAGTAGVRHRAEVGVVPGHGLVPDRDDILSMLRVSGDSVNRTTSMRRGGNPNCVTIAGRWKSAGVIPSVSRGAPNAASAAYTRSALAGSGSTQMSRSAVARGTPCALSA
jgi:hypothetical protein